MGNIFVMMVQCAYICCYGSKLLGFTIESYDSSFFPFGGEGVELAHGHDIVPRILVLTYAIFPMAVAADIPVHHLLLVCCTEFYSNSCSSRR